MNRVTRLVVRVAARLSAANRQESGLITAEWAEQVAARRTAVSRAGHALMLLVSVGMPATGRRFVLRTPWFVIAMALAVLAAVLCVGSFAVRDQSERVFQNYGPEDQAADPEYQAWKAEWGETMQSGDAAARQDAWDHLMDVGPWRAAENLRKLADITFMVSLAILFSALIAVSLAVVRRLGEDGQACPGPFDAPRAGAWFVHPLRTRCRSSDRTYGPPCGPRVGPRPDGLLRTALEALMAAPRTESSRPGMSVGPTSEFSLFFRVKPGEAESLRRSLHNLQDTPGYRPGDYGIAVQTIHEARFVLFDDDTRLAFVTSFDGPWDAYMEDFFTSGPTLSLFDVIFRHVEGYDGLPDLAAVKEFILGAEQTAAAYARNYGGTVKEIRKAQRVNNAFQQVLDHPDAAEALRHPALKPLLDEAAD